MADHNNQRSQKFDSFWSAKNTEAVGFKGSNPKETALLENIRSLVVAAIQDIYGTTEDRKYIYIVDLILKRIKQTLIDHKITTDVETIRTEVSDLKQSLVNAHKSDTSSSEFDEKSLLKDIEKIVLSVNTEIEQTLCDYFEAQKAELEQLKTQISNIAGTARTIEKPERQEELEEVEEDFQTELPSDLLDQLSLITVSVKQLETTMLSFVEMISVEFSEIQTTIDTRFSEITTTLTTINKNLDDSMTSTSKSFDDTALKIEQSNKSILNAISQISSSGKNSALGSIGSSLINGITSITTGLLSSITTAMIGLTSGIASSVASTIKSNEILGKIDKIDSTTTSMMKTTSKTLAVVQARSIAQSSPATKPFEMKQKKLPKILSKPKLFAQLIAKHLAKYQEKSIKQTEDSIEELNWSLHGKFKSLKYGFQQTFERLNRAMRKGFKTITNRIKGLGSALKDVGTNTIKGLSFVFKTLLGPIGFAVSGVFSMFSFIFKPLKWILGLLKSPLLLVTIGLIIFALWPKIKKPIMKFVTNIYQKYIEPIINHVKPLFKTIQEIWSGKGSFFDKIKSTFSAIAENIMQGIKKVWTEVIWPWIKTDGWNFIKSNWKTILIGLGLFDIFFNGGGIFKTILPLLTKVSGQLIGKAASVLCNPVGAAAALAVGGLWFAYDSFQQSFGDNTREMKATNAKNFDETIKRGEELKKKVDQISKTTEDMYKSHKRMIKAAGYDKEVETYEMVNDQGKAIKVDKDMLDKQMKKISESFNTKSSLDTIQSDGHFNFDVDAYNDKDRYLSRAIVQINGIIQQTVNFAKSFAEDPTNRRVNKDILKKYQRVVTAANVMKKEAFKALQGKLTDAIDNLARTGSDEDWKGFFEDAVDKVGLWSKTQIAYLTTTDKDMSAKLDAIQEDQIKNERFWSINNRDVDLYKIRNEQIERAKEAAGLKYSQRERELDQKIRRKEKLTESELKEKEAFDELKRQRKILVDKIQTQIDMAQEASRKINTFVYNSVNSGDMDRVNKMLKDKQTAYATTFGEALSKADEKAKEVAKKMVDDYNIAFDATKTNDETREMFEKLATLMIKQKISTGQGSKLTQTDQYQILAEVKKELEKRREGETDKNSQRFIDLSKSLEGITKAIENIQPAQTQITNNNTMVAISGGQAIAQQNKENITR